MASQQINSRIKVKARLHFIHISSTSLKTTYVNPVEDIAIMPNSVYVNQQKIEINFQQKWNSRWIVQTHRLKLCIFQHEDGTLDKILSCISCPPKLISTCHEAESCKLSVPYCKGIHIIFINFLWLALTVLILSYSKQKSLNLVTYIKQPQCKNGLLSQSCGW